jgi:hypothetical protein
LSNRRRRSKRTGRWSGQRVSGNAPTTGESGSKAYDTNYKGEEKPGCRTK